MKLLSNFSDYMDHAFSGQGTVYNRIGGNSGPRKRDQFSLLEKAGFLTPPHGLVGDILDTWWTAENRWVSYVVAYEDEMAHCTEGKRLLNHHDFQLLGATMNGGPESYRLSNLYCSAFVGHPCQSPAISWRRLQIGPRVFWLEYRGDDNWMSNLGEGSCQVIGTDHDGFHPVINLPLFAIDFVLGKEMYAIDFNSAPGIRGSGVEKLLSPKAAVEAIEEWHAMFGAQNHKENYNDE